MTPLDGGRDYCRRGWQVVANPPGKKAPKLPDWQNLSLRIGDLPQYFGRGENIGVILGPKSRELVDIDLDCIEALTLADLYIPPTQAEFGRTSAPRSHRLYVAPSAIFEAFVDPITKDTLLELRAEGRDGGAHQTLLPPSITDGEQREWHGDVIAQWSSMLAHCGS